VTASWSCFADPGDVPVPDAGGTKPTVPPADLQHWYDLSNLPFIPVPSIGADPNSGTTVGLLPVWLHTDENHEITRIIAPDVTHNPFFGWGVHGRLYSYNSTDEQWSIVVERGRRSSVTSMLNTSWGGCTRGISLPPLTWISIATARRASLASATTRGSPTSRTTPPRRLCCRNNSVESDASLAVAVHHRKRILKVLPGTLSSTPSIQTVFGTTRLGTNSELLNRYSVVYDTRRRSDRAAYGGCESLCMEERPAAAASFNESLYSEAGGDARGYWSNPTGTRS